MSKCEWPFVPCESQKARPVRFQNAFGDTVYQRLCPEHIATIQDEGKMADLNAATIDTLQRTHPGVTPTQLYESEAHRAVAQHNQTCGICGVAAAHVRGMIARGEVKTEADQYRVGEYIIAHCCEVGVYLNEQAGLAAQKLREQG